MVPGLVTCYLPASFTAFTSPGSGIVLVWVGVGVVYSVVAGVRTWWWHGVCVWGGVKRQRSGTPSWGKRACVAPIGVVWGPGAGDQRRGRVSVTNGAPFLGCWWLLWGCGTGLVPKAEGSPSGAAPWCAVRVSTGGACVGVRTVASWGRVSVSERAAWGRVERDRRV